ncbi:hypothetical protein C8R44DRAFT_749529 [Mycena epipterygia]|nr:hypothetical protein C8R44DRAFT_749529 [Mycena epipterygia]
MTRDKRAKGICWEILRSIQRRQTVTWGDAEDVQHRASQHWQTLGLHALLIFGTTCAYLQLACLNDLNGAQWYRQLGHITSFLRPKLNPASASPSTRPHRYPLLCRVVPPFAIPRLHPIDLRTNTRLIRLISPRSALPAGSDHAATRAAHADTPAHSRPVVRLRLAERLARSPCQSRSQFRPRLKNNAGIKTNGRDTPSHLPDIATRAARADTPAHSRVVVRLRLAKRRGRLARSTRCPSHAAQLLPSIRARTAARELGIRFNSQRVGSGSGRRERAFPGDSMDLEVCMSCIGRIE